MPVANEPEYLYRRNCGSVTCPIMAAVASEEPLIVPNAAHPPIAAMARPPRKWPMKALAARNSAVVTPARLAKLPIIRNSGITEKSNDENRQYISVLRKLRSGTDAGDRHVADHADDDHRHADRHPQRNQDKERAKSRSADRQIAHRLSPPAA